MEYVFPQKSKLKQISIGELNKNLPDLKNVTSPKSAIVAKWLMERIDNDANLKPATLLPSKADLAYLLGVSVGTVQNSLRYIEDLGYVESKQCIGTIIRDKNNAEKSIRKLTSKREIAINSIKQFIKDRKLQINNFLPSSRIISNAIGCSTNTTRLALENLSLANIIEPHESGWKIKSIDFEIEKSENETLVEKVECDLKNYITKNFKIGDRIPPHATLSKELSVSIKTIHDALKALINSGILLARRGRYGTTVIKMPEDSKQIQSKETSIFASAPETAFYHYEKTQNYIKKMIAENYDVGSKLPSINELSKMLDLSPNTIRKAFHNLAEEGYLVFSRGRYGGTFVVDIPETDSQTFKWLAVNPKYAQIYK